MFHYVPWKRNFGLWLVANPQRYEDMLSTMRNKMGLQADVVTYGSLISSCERGEAANGFGWW